MSHLNFVYLYSKNCIGLEMSEKFVKNMHILDDILDKLDIDEDKSSKYDQLARINTDWIKSKFNLDDKFIEWWTYCVQNKLFDLLDDVDEYNDSVYMTGFTIVVSGGDGFVSHNIKLPVDFDNQYDFYVKFLLQFELLCNVCNFYSDCCGNNGFNKRSQCYEYKEIYLANLYQLQEYGNYMMNPHYSEITSLQKETKDLNDRLNTFDKYHKNDCEHMRLDVETTAKLIINNTQKQKIYCEETDMHVSDLQDRIDKLEFLLSGNINYKIIDRAIEFPKRSIATIDMIDELKQVIADQKQMINDLNKKIDQQHQEFEAYKLQKQRQLAAIMA